MTRLHQYKALITWTGNIGTGTKSYNGYERSHNIEVEGKPLLQASSDPSFNGDPSKYNPEELFLSSLSSCHMLWYLHLCSVKNIIVLTYTDSCVGEMKENEDGSGQFVSVSLFPVVIVANETMTEQANALHAVANKMCFIANSCNFEVKHFPSCNAK